MTSNIISNHHLHLTSPETSQKCFFLYLRLPDLYQHFDSHSVVLYNQCMLKRIAVHFFDEYRLLYLSLGPKGCQQIYKSKQNRFFYGMFYSRFFVRYYQRCSWVVG